MAAAASRLLRQCEGNGPAASATPLSHTISLSTSRHPNLCFHAKLAAISAILAHSSPFRKLRKSSRLGTLMDRYHSASVLLTIIMMDMADMNMVMMKKQKCSSFLTMEDCYCIELPKNMGRFRYLYTTCS
jgi:hypothetical protein